MDLLGEADAFLASLNVQGDARNTSQPHTVAVSSSQGNTEIICTGEVNTTAALESSTTLSADAGLRRSRESAALQTAATSNAETLSPTGTAKRRRNRWGTPLSACTTPTTDDGGDLQPQDASTEQRKRKRKSRWEAPESTSSLIVTSAPKEIILPGGIKVSLPPTLMGGTSSDPQVKELHDQLNTINNKILNNDLNLPPEHDRSPSPEPVYDRNGIRLNTREVRAKDKLMQMRSKLIEELIKADTSYRPPADYRPAKKYRKIYIPQKDYPSYNFIGLIIGPRGNTQKRMQKETNTKIAIRGKGSVKEGAARDPKYDYGEDEELHVLITGETQEDADKAAEMIQDLLVPTDEARNEHKRLQLRELAALNGTLKDDQHCYLCGQSGHRQFECPTQSEDTFRLPVAMKQKVDALYQRDITRMGGNIDGSTDEDYKNFMAELGMNEASDDAKRSSRDQNLGGQVGLHGHHGIGYDNGRGLKSKHGADLPSDCKLYVGNLPTAANDAMLKQLFEPFGQVLHAVVLLDVNTGHSRGYGFVHMENSTAAGVAAREMSGKNIDGRLLVVRLRSEGQSKSADRSWHHSDDSDAKLYVSLLAPHIDDGNLQQMFRQYGEVLSCRVIVDRETGKSKGYGFITMDTASSAAAAIIGLNGYVPPGSLKPMSVKIAENRQGAIGRGSKMGRGTSGVADQSTAGWGGNLPQAQLSNYNNMPGSAPNMSGYEGQPGAPAAMSHGAFSHVGIYGVPRPMYGLPTPYDNTMQYYGAQGAPSQLLGHNHPYAPGIANLPPHLQHEQPLPPVPSEAPPPPKEDRVQSEYERFMAEMQSNY